MMNRYDKGYISLYRKFKNWRYYTNDNIKSVFIHCLLSACWEDTVISEYNGKPIKPIVLKRGSFITSYRKMGKELGKTPSEVRWALQQLSSAKITHTNTTHSNAHELEVITTQLYTLINVLNFDTFQPLVEVLTHTKNRKECTLERTQLQQHINKDINKDKIDKIDKIDKSVSTPLKEHNSLTIKLLESGFITEGDIPETYDALFEEYLESNSYAHLFVILDYILKRAHPSRIKNKYSYLKKSINSNLKKMELLKRNNRTSSMEMHDLENLIHELEKEGKL